MNDVAPSAPPPSCCAPDIVGRLSSPYRKYGCGNRPSSRALATEGGSALVRLESAARPPIALERLTRRDDGCVEYAFRKPWRDGTRAVVLTPEEYDRLAYERTFVEAVGMGLKDAEEGKVVTHEEAIRRLTEVIAASGQA